MGSWVERTCGKAGAGGLGLEDWGGRGVGCQTRRGGDLRTGWSHIHVQINL